MSLMRTFQTRFDISGEADCLLTDCAALLSKVERHLFRSLQCKNHSIASLKVAYLRRFGITARHFNSCRALVEGKIRSLKELRSQRIVSLKDKIDGSRKRLASRGNLGQEGQKRHKQHQKLAKQTSCLARLQKDQEEGVVRLCFGSKKLFKAQFNLNEQGYSSHKDWKQDWVAKRNQSFFLMGSKDETAGNQSCSAILQEDGAFTLRLRLPDSLASQGKYLLIPNIRFSYGHEELTQAVQENYLRNQLQKKSDPSYAQKGKAISFRFMRDKKGWRVFASTEAKPARLQSDSRLGYIGVDLNVEHLAISETNRHGNLVSHHSKPLMLYGKSSEQAKAIRSDAAKAVVELAKTKGKPIVIEKLDFQSKKKALCSEPRASYCRMLSSFAYKSSLEALKTRALREGIEVLEVNPAFTSLIGKLKFAKQYGLSIHHAAAFCIARRVAKFSESLPSYSDVPDGKGGHIAFVVPVRNPQKTDWAHLGIVSKKFRAAHVEHIRMTKRQSLGP